MSAALDMMNALRLPDGRQWGEAAQPNQLADAQAVLDPSEGGPRRHWVGRPKGGAKTDDAGGFLLAELVCGLIPPDRPAYAAAADRDQAALILASLRGFVQRSGLDHVVELQAYRAVHRSSGASIEIMAADTASSYGLRPFRLVIDELCQFNDTPRSKEFFQSLWSGLAKARDSVGLICTTAGTFGHFSYGVYQQALKEPRLWRVSMVHEPAAWIDGDLVAAERRSLTESAYLRLWRNEWAAADEALVSGDDLAAAARDDDSPIPPVEGRSYVLSLDVGTVSDRTVLVVAHKEGDVVVVDRLWRWVGSRRHPVDLDAVEAQIVEAHNRYVGPVILDPHQAVQIKQRLEKRGITARQFDFTTSSVGLLASCLLTLLRARRLSLPNDSVLLNELANVRIRENAAGTPRLDHVSGAHDDQAVALALAAYRLTDGTPPVRRGARIKFYPRVASW